MNKIDMKKNIVKNFLFITVAVLAIFFISFCNNQKELINILGNTMGTTYKIVIVSEKNGLDKNELKKDIDRLLDEVNLEMSTFLKNSEISKFNMSVSTDWFPVSLGFAKVVKNSLDICKRSNGVFDISIGPLIDLWGFGKKIKNRVPSNEEIDSIVQHIGYEKLRVRLSPPSIKKSVSKLQINLSATAKGYGVDKVAELLDLKNFKNYLVEIGGEVRVRGKKFNRKWRIGVVTPDTLNEYHRIVFLSDITLATSGDYFNYFEKNGKRYSHIINPITKKPIDHKLASVTIAHKSCMIADGFSTAIFAMGPDEGYQFALKENLPIYMIIRKGNSFYVKMTPSFKTLFNE